MKFPIPWASGRQSICGYIRSHVRADSSSAALPDDDVFWGKAKVRWVAGGLDGAFARHGNPSRDQERASEIVLALRAVIEAQDLSHLNDLYQLLLSANPLDAGDPMIETISEDPFFPSEELAELVRWLAEEAPDRRAVKFALLMLGAVGDSRDAELVMALGRHEEFSLFAAEALLAMVKDPGPILLDLAEGLSGWGRIQMVQRMEGAQDPAVKHWLLREGYRNNVMPEYTAGICARTGDLAQALQDPDPDPALLQGAGKILGALLSGAPGDGMAGYPDAAEAALLYLAHLQARAPRDLSPFWVVHGLKEFVGKPEVDWTEPTLRGWTMAARRQIAERTAAILISPAWRDIATTWLGSAEDSRFFEASRVLEKLGVDTWEVRFERWKSGNGIGHSLFQTDDPERVDRILAVYGDRLDLSAIGAGPGEELGLGAAFSNHQALDAVLQALPRFPGRGAEFVEAALRSPVIRNRNAAVRVLARWGEGAWPDGTRERLEIALTREPNADVLQRIRNLLRGALVESGIREGSASIH